MTYSKKKRLEAMALIFSVLVILVVVVMASSYFSLKDSTKYGIAAIFLVGFLYYPFCVKMVKWASLFLEPLMSKNIDQAIRAKKGIDGENEVNSWLEEIVGKENTIRNVQLPDCKFDIDEIVVFDRGVLVVEVKNFTNPIHFEEGDYFQIKNGQQISCDPKKDPCFQVRHHAYILREYLDSVGFKSVAVNKIIVFANGEVTWNGSPGAYIIKNKESLEKYITELAVDANCTPQICDKIKKSLKKHSRF